MAIDSDIARRVVTSKLYPLILGSMTDEERDELGPVFDVAKAQMSHLEFMRFCWGRTRPMQVGIHTWYICKQIDIAFDNFRKGKSTFLMALVCFRSGKLLSDRTPILTPSGWTTHGALQIGDFVYNSDGLPVRVLALTPKGQADYKIKFSDFSEIVAHACHEWPVYNECTNCYEIKETRQLLQEGFHKFVLKARRILSIEKCEPELGHCIQVEGGIYLAGRTLIPTHNSEITTRYLPAHFLAEFPDREVIVTSHSTKNTNKFSRFGRDLIRSKKFQMLYPGNELSVDNAGVEEWGLSGKEGLAQYFGISAGISGVGGALIVTDDYFGKREEAESPNNRDKIWEAYTDNIFTRRDDPSINIITVTPWHTDDLVGRLQKAMHENADTTPYKVIRLPYKDPDAILVDELSGLLQEETDEELKEGLQVSLEKYANGGYLFPEKYSAQWYQDMVEALGGPSGYSVASLMRCNPKSRIGSAFRTENVKILKYDEFERRTRGLTFVRAWDLASTVKQTLKSDPDYTVGVKLAVRWSNTCIKGVRSAEVYVMDVIRGRWESTKRKEVIISTAIKDGLIKIGIEAFGQYKDAFDEMKTILQGVRVVNKMKMPGDKFVKASSLQPVFDAGNFYVLESHWNQEYIDEYIAYPGAHDDQIDATVVALGMNKPVEAGFQYDEQFIL